MTTSARIRRDRGVTLVELLVALAITSVVLAALFGVVQSQQNAYFQGHLQRAAQGNARAALEYVQQRLGVAGYGMDAPLAFDFQYYGTADAMPCPIAGGCLRDRVNENDELVFYARNPRYWVPDDRSGAVLPSGNAWRVVSLTSTTLTVVPKPGDKFEKGRIVQLVCKDGATYLYATVARNVPTITAPAPVSQTILLVPGASPPTNPFRAQSLTGPGDCFNSGNARAFLIDRFRFHVRPVASGNGYRGYLMLDRGLDENNDGPDEAEEIVVAEGIESFQVGYVMTGPALEPRGTRPGVQIVFTAGAPGSKTGTGMTTLSFPGTVNPGQWAYQPTSFYRYAIGSTVADERLTDHQGNIRGVRIAIVARGPDPDPAKRRTEVVLPVLNQTALPAWAATQAPYSRARVETTVPVRNMTTRAMNDF